MFKKYDADISKIIDLNKVDVEWDKILKYHKKMMKRIQHERLIHLIVTVFVGLVMTMSCLATIVSAIPYILLLDIPLIVLFCAYIFHYRFLENTTQKWYEIEDKISKNL